jgi:hypothetical protein
MEPFHFKKKLEWSHSVQVNSPTKRSVATNHLKVHLLVKMDTADDRDQRGGVGGTNTGRRQPILIQYLWYS